MKFLISRNLGVEFGDLNVIAPVITMFFLITYGMLNFATLYETLAGSPSFRNPEWQGHEIRIFRVVGQKEEKGPAAKNMQILINRARIEATSEAILSSEPIFQVIEKVSRNSSLVFLGLNIPEARNDKEFFEQLAANLENLPTVLAVKSVLDENIILS